MDDRDWLLDLPDWQGTVEALRSDPRDEARAMAMLVAKALGTT